MSVELHRTINKTVSFADEEVPRTPARKVKIEPITRTLNKIIGLCIGEPTFIRVNFQLLVGWKSDYEAFATKPPKSLFERFVTICLRNSRKVKDELRIKKFAKMCGYEVDYFGPKELNIVQLFDLGDAIEMTEF